MLLLWLRRASRATALGALAFVVVGTWLSGQRLERAGRQQQRAVTLLTPPARCELRGEVANSPVVRQVAGATPREGDVRIDFDVHAGRCGDHLVADPLRIRLYGAPRGLGRGDMLEVIADVAPLQAFRNPGLGEPLVRRALTGVVASGGLVDVPSARRGGGVRRSVDAARSHVRERIEASYPAALAPMARALVLGESDLADDEQAAFRNSGLAHLLAVSGTHLVIAVLAFGRVLRALLLRLGPLAERHDVGALAAAACVPLSWLYADFAGGGGSAYRAAAMLTVGLSARALGRRPCSVRAFALSLLAGAAIEPLAACDLSFALSVAATGGLIGVQPLARRIAPTSVRPLRMLLVAAVSTCAATMACLPVLLAIGAPVPLLTIVANVLAAPVGELLALPSCLLHTVLGWWGDAEHGAALVASGALAWVRAVAHATSSAAWARFVLPPPTDWQLATLCVVLAGMACVARRRARWCWCVVGVATVLVLELSAQRAGAPRDVLRVTTLDVGQGDALLVDLPDGRLMLVDGGGMVGSPIDLGKRVIVPVLRHRRRNRIDVVVLSHPHPDHYLGLLHTVEQLEIGELWENGQAHRHHGPALLAETLRRRGVPVRAPPTLCGTHRFGAAAVEVLAPCPRPLDGRRVNDNSLVLRIRMGHRAVLLTGDAEQEEEEALLARHGERLGADLLKVGHHGSRTSSHAAFLDAVGPELAVVSCGVRNRFGHPSQATLRALASRRIALWRNDQLGALLWQTDGDVIRIRASPRGSWLEP